MTAESTLLALIVQSPLGAVAAVVWGALWGSFFNVVIVRVPQGLSVVRPASFCQRCGSPLRWYDNIPLLSYLLLRGKCRFCHAAFSPRYLFVEALVALLAFLCYLQFVQSGEGELGLRVARFVIASLFSGTLVAIAVIDAQTMLIPNAITYPAIPACILLSPLLDLPRIWDGLVGAAAGYLVIRLIADGYHLLTGRLGMGYGDAKLLAMIGGLLGWHILLPTLFLASLQGSIIGISLLLLTRKTAAPPAPDGATDEADADPADAAGDTPPPLRHAQIPFGPFLSLAAIELLLLRPWLASFVPFFFFR